MSLYYMYVLPIILTRGKTGDGGCLVHPPDAAGSVSPHGGDRLNPIEMRLPAFPAEVTHCELFETKQALLAAARDFFGVTRLSQT